MLLHLVNKSPSSNSSLKECLRATKTGASILLLEDGVYAATQAYATLFTQHPQLKIYALRADVLARGLSAKLQANVTIASDDDFVELCVSHHSVQSWF